MLETFKISAAIVTSSDSRTIENDLSGMSLRSLLEEHGAVVVHHSVVTDDLDEIRTELLALAGRSDVNLILTTGGTGLGPRDNTPEATLSMIEREVPGIAEAMRNATVSKTPTAILARSVAGIRNRTLIINLPGSPKAVTECFEVIGPILDHAVRMVSGHTQH